MTDKDAKDYMTGLYNMHYLEKIYNSYISQNHNAKMIEIDLTNFKGINDNYGHDGGDACLGAFSAIMRMAFKELNSSIIRRGGDEFVILTNDDESDIARKLNMARSIIGMYYDSGKLPVSFCFNAGVTRAEHGLKETLQKADVMMYDAKEKKKLITFFNDEIYHEYEKKQKFVNDFDTTIRNNEFELIPKTLYDIDGNDAGIREVYSMKDKDTPLYNNKIYELLRKGNKLRVLDSKNLLTIFNSYDFSYNKYMINLHNQTLDSDEFVSKVLALADINSVNPNDTILNINIGTVKYSLDNLTAILSELKFNGFKLCLEPFGERLDNVPKIMFDSDLDYIKFDSCMWKKGINNKKVMNFIKYNIMCFNVNGIVPILGKVETMSELDYLKDISDGSKVLVKGDLFDKKA